jgi:hypothetical protein
MSFCLILRQNIIQVTNPLPEQNPHPYTPATFKLETDHIDPPLPTPAVLLQKLKYDGLASLIPLPYK